MPEDFDEGRLPRALAGLDALARDLGSDRSRIMARIA
jgi:hypothetical protein